MLSQWTPREWLGTVEEMKSCHHCLNISGIEKMVTIHLLFVEKRFTGIRCTLKEEAAIGSLAEACSGTRWHSWAVVRCPPDCFEVSLDFWVVGFLRVDGVGTVLGRFPQGAGRSCTAQMICLMPSRMALFSGNTVSSARVYEL